MDIIASHLQALTRGSLRRFFFAIFLLAQIFAATLAGCWIVRRILLEKSPLPGTAVAIVAALAALMSVHADMRPWQKAVWISLIGAFVWIELQAINADRTIADTNAEIRRKAEDKAFENLIKEQATEFANTKKGIEKILGDNQSRFNQTEAKLGEAIFTQTGGPTYCYLEIRRGDGEWDMYLHKTGKYPLRNLRVIIKDESLIEDWEQRNPQSMWKDGPLNTLQARIDRYQKDEHDATSNEFKFENLSTEAVSLGPWSTLSGIKPNPKKRPGLEQTFSASFSALNGEWSEGMHLSVGRDGFWTESISIRQGSKIIWTNNEMIPAH